MVGKQSGREIRPFETETGEELLFLYPGMRKQDEVFDYEHAQNRLQTWIYRLLGWLAMFLGYNCVSNLLDIIGMYILRLPPMKVGLVKLFCCSGRYPSNPKSFGLGSDIVTIFICIIHIFTIHWDWMATLQTRHWIRFAHHVSISISLGSL